MNAAASPYMLTLEDTSVLAALPPPPLEAAGLDTVLPEFLDRLAVPVSADDPCGPYLRLGEPYNAVRIARKADNRLATQGIWQIDLKVADWFQVRDLCRSALLESTRDVQLALWLTEAWTHLHGFAGLAAGLRVCHHLQETYGDVLHPRRTDPDHDHPMQAAVVWGCGALKDLAQHLPLLPAQGSSGDLMALCLLDTDVARQGRAAGSVTSEQLEAVLKATPSDLLLQRLETCTQAEQAAGRWAAAIPTLMAGYEASLSPLRDALIRIIRLLREECDQRGLNPDGLDDLMHPEDLHAPLPAGEAPTAGAGSSPVASPVAPPQRTGLASREDAYRALEEVAEFLMRNEPHSPVPYMLRRAHRWGQMPLSDLLMELSEQGIGLADLVGLMGLHGRGG